VAGFQVNKKTIFFVMLAIAILVLAIVGIGKVFNIDLLQTSNLGDFIGNSVQVGRDTGENGAKVAPGLTPIKHCAYNDTGWFGCV
jgi:hypothetical protein